MVKKDLSEQDLLIKAQNYCSLAEHCVSEVKDKLYQWGASVSVQDRITGALLDSGFVDESRYAAAFVHDKVAFQGWGREKIRMMLVMKRISLTMVDAALKEIDKDTYVKNIDYLIEQKRGSLSAEDPSYTAKLVRFLSQRGFTMDEIMSRPCVAPH